MSDKFKPCEYVLNRKPKVVGTHPPREVGDWWIYETKIGQFELLRPTYGRTNNDGEDYWCIFHSKRRQYVTGETQMIDVDPPREVVGDERKLTSLSDAETALRDLVYWGTVWREYVEYWNAPKDKDKE